MTVKKSPQSTELLPPGAVRIEWPKDADFEEEQTLVWSILKPEDWAQNVPLGWRWTPEQLAIEVAASAR